ncbi:MAG: urate hydroxylase PuuD, partial [Novosphingobium meiothermophilum]
AMTLTGEGNVRLIGIGMWLALIMAFNVWFIIWPAQKKILGIVEASAEEKAAAAPRALYASRTNTLLSIPMLYAMVSANLG